MNTFRHRRDPRRKHRKVQHIIPLPGGWSPSTLYLVEVKFHPNNPVFRSTFYSGFLDARGKPAGYSEHYKPGMGETEQLEEVFYMRVIQVLATAEELDTMPDEPTINPPSDNATLPPNQD